jgi:signal transduction histidine kinase
MKKYKTTESHFNISSILYESLAKYIDAFNGSYSTIVLLLIIIDRNNPAMNFSASVITWVLFMLINFTITQLTYKIKKFIIMEYLRLISSLAVLICFYKVSGGSTLDYWFGFGLLIVGTSMTFFNIGKKSIFNFLIICFTYSILYVITTEQITDAIIIHLIGQACFFILIGFIITLTMRNLISRTQAHMFSMKAEKDALEKVHRTEKLAAIGQLSSSIAHELRNPLGSIKNAHYFLKTKLNKVLDSNKYKIELQFIDVVGIEVDRCNNIINDLLDFSRQKQLKKEPTRIKPIISKILKSITISKNIVVINNFVIQQYINSDPEQLHYALSNIILNAIQSMEKGGKLNIETNTKKDYVEILISDTGCGIPEEIKDKIFEPLVSTKIKGTGLGLSIVKNIIDAHGGKIKVESKVGEGTTFKIILPVV